MFSVVRETRLELAEGRDVGRGRVEAVPGTPLELAAPVESSVRCELVMTECAGSKISSLCSPPVKSHSTDTPARNFSAPSSGSRVALIFESRSRSEEHTSEL